MAYNTNKFVKLFHLKTAIEKIKEVFATKSEVNEVGQTVTDLQQNNNSAHNMMNGRIGSLESGLNSLQNDLSQTTQGLQYEINSKLSSVYKPGGSKTFAQLPTSFDNTVPPIGESRLGMVYNVTDAFTTTDLFAEGAGKSYPAGTNVVVIQDGGAYKLDVLAGFVDLSGYVEKADGKVLSSNDYTDEEKTKLAGLSNYTHPAHTAQTSGLYKITVNAQGHVSAATAVAKADITGLGIPAQDTTYSDMTAATASAAGAAGLVPAPAAGSQNKFLRGDGTWVVPTNTTYSPATASANGLMTKEDKSKLDGFEIATDAEVDEMLDELFAS